MLIFSVVLGFVYGVVPFFTYLLMPVNEQFLQLSVLTLCAILAMFLGSKIGLFDRRFKPNAPRLVISSRIFLFVVWGLFVLFIAVTFSTAPSIPIISALQGASASELSQERGDFLKGREGVGVALLYISTFLSTTLIPYSIVLLYATGSKLRHIAALFFLLFCVSFMQKALFLNLVLPLLVFLSVSRKLSKKLFFGLVAASIFLLIASTFLSLGGEAGGGSDFEFSVYFSAQYLPSNPFDYFLWRALAVPVFTATDTLVVYAEQFRLSPLFGATSSFLSFIFDLERINIERFVFEHQFGSWNEIANANSVFVTDAYVNFSWIGVVSFGIFVGQVFRIFRLSGDIAFCCLWPLFALGMFTGSLIGALLSNGFILLFSLALFLKVKVVTASKVPLCLRCKY